MQHGKTRLSAKKTGLIGLSVGSSSLVLILTVLKSINTYPQEGSSRGFFVQMFECVFEILNRERDIQRKCWRISHQLFRFVANFFSTGLNLGLDFHLDLVNILVFAHYCFDTFPNV